jgi:hypothetical protein
MWAAVGEPEKKPRWEHLGIIKTFVRGRWFDARAGFRGPGIFESQRFASHRLYDLRLKADYRLDDIGQEEAQWAVQIVQEIIAIAEQKDARDATQDEEV